jgi:hypothetical protein
MKTTFSRLAFAAALSFGVALPAAAQQQQHGQYRQEQGQGQRQDPRQRLDQRVAQLTQRLRLNQGQATQVRRILEQEQQRMQQFRGSRDGQRQGQDRARQGGDDAQRRQGFEQMRALRQQTDQQIERVLNRTQLAEYRKLRDERGQWGRGQRGEGRQGQGRQQGQGSSSR